MLAISTLSDSSSLSFALLRMKTEGVITTTSRRPSSCGIVVTKEYYYGMDTKKDKQKNKDRLETFMTTASMLLGFLAGFNLSVWVIFNVQPFDIIEDPMLTLRWSIGLSIFSFLTLFYYKKVKSRQT